MDVASFLPIPQVGQINSAGVGSIENINSSSADKGQKVLTRAMQRYLALIRDLEAHYAPQEVPGVDVRERPESPRFTVSY
jgi:hypothetical protein